MKVRLTLRALADIDAIVGYIRNDSPAAARRVQAELDAALQLIASFPEVGRRLERDVRRLAVPRLPYLIFYRIEERQKQVSVITVRHGARKPFS